MCLLGAWIPSLSTTGMTLISYSLLLHRLASALGKRHARLLEHTTACLNYHIWVECVKHPQTLLSVIPINFTMQAPVLDT